MERYDGMLEKKKKINTEKEKLAIRMIRAMMEAGEQVTVGALIKRTGLSRSIFYQNQSVKDAMNKAKRNQLGTVYAREERLVIQKAMQQEEKILKRKLEVLQAENRFLKQILKEHGIEY